MIIATKTGQIEVIESPDPEFRGVWIRVDGQELVLVEYDHHRESNIARIWTKEKDNNGDDPVAVINLDE